MAQRAWRMQVSHTKLSASNLAWLARRQRIKELKELIRTPYPEYSELLGGLMLYPNWYDYNKSLKIVLRCNTRLLGSSWLRPSRPAAAMHLKNGKLKSLTLKSREDLERALDTGRVWIFPSNLKVKSKYLVVLPASHTDPRGKAVFASLPTVGRYQGQTFATGLNFAGLFLDPKLKDRLVVRPMTNGCWLGYSSQVENGRLIVRVDSLLHGEKSIRSEFQIPAGEGYQNRAALPCAQADDQGGTIGVFTMNPAIPKSPPRKPSQNLRAQAARIQAPHVELLSGSQCLVAYANSRDAHGQPCFSACTNATINGRNVYLFSTVIDGESRALGFKANAKSPDGRALYVRQANQSIHGRFAAVFKIA